MNREQEIGALANEGWGFIKIKRTHPHANAEWTEYQFKSPRMRTFAQYDRDGLISIRKTEAAYMANQAYRAMKDGLEDRSVKLLTAYFESNPRSSGTDVQIRPIIKN
jgi:hypothetical protein